MHSACPSDLMKINPFIEYQAKDENQAKIVKTRPKYIVSYRNT